MRLQHKFGIDQYAAKQQGKTTEVIYDSDAMINPHVLLAGSTGTGKSHQLRELLDRASMYIDGDSSIDIFDVHAELDIGQASVVKYSAQTGYGYNPLIINPDVHSGGVLNSINNFIRLVNTTTVQLGTKQQATLRYLMIDLYAERGITEDNVRSWRMAYEKQPSIQDLIDFTRTKVLTTQFGTDSIATNVQSITRLVKGIRRSKLHEAARQKLSVQGHAVNEDLSAEEAADQGSVEEMESQLDKLNEKTENMFQLFLKGLKTGDELDVFFKYNNKEVMMSLVERLTTINSAGIFNHNPPPFDSNVRCHEIMSLGDDFQKLFVYMRLEAIFREARDRGHTSEIRYIVVLDEAHKFFKDESDNIINIIAKEGRKFGIALWCASQSPTHFSEEFLINTACIVLLGIHSSYWDMAVKRLRIKLDNLKWTKPKKVVSIKMQLKGASDPQFRSVVLASYESEFLAEIAQGRAA
ncbi:MAG: helicase HerA domain-containing protein [Methylophilus sp.]|uniref:helicase HerA domain-containing protein n=1 Tax=Methylophilus sp. TaxID=29541 RepID=UPI003F9FBB8B